MNRNDYECVIGLEVHVQLLTRSKLFCACPNEFGAEPNAHTDPVCLGWPGSLPVLNEEALRLAVKVGLALDCEVARRTKFDRKHYFYPDLPKAYQISQYDMPVNGPGHLMIEMETAQGGYEKRRIGIIRAHLEEDAGKLIHEAASKASLVDYNRAGVPLLEIVSAPDLRSPAEAYEYLVALKAILEYLEVSDCNMEEGSLRCDANVSIRRKGDARLGTKTEIKNLNSFKSVQRALEYEMERQLDRLTDGEQIVQETRLWNEAKGQTCSMRSKEEAHDYRYFPEPDLVPVTLSEEFIREVRETLPELPAARAERFMRDYGLGPYDALVLVREKKLADYFEACAGGKIHAKLVSNWIQTELLGLLHEAKLGIENSPVNPRDLAGLIELIEDGTINGKMAKEILPEMFRTGRPAQVIVKAKGLVQVTDPGIIEAAAEKAIAENPEVVAQYRGGKKQALGFLVGQIMKATQGKANPRLVNEILAKKLS